jgi:hypothetical protein
VNYQRRRYRSTLSDQIAPYLVGFIRSPGTQFESIVRPGYSLQSESLRVREIGRFSVAGLACQLHSKEPPGRTEGKRR